MRRSRRKALEVGPDGTAPVTLLTNPLPRAMSIVDYGANDIVASSWLSASGVSQDAVSSMREPPPMEVVSSTSMKVIGDFVVAVVDAWKACVLGVMTTPLNPGERQAQILSFTAQAAARVAAAINSTKASFKTYRSMDLSAPTPSNVPTIDGVLDFAAMNAAMDEACRFLVDATLTAARDTIEASPSEQILRIFYEVGQFFAEWAGEHRPGVIGVAQKSASTTHLHEGSKMITLAQFEEMATKDPAKFVAVLKSVADAYNAQQPKSTVRFAWGDTGFTPEDVSAIMSTIGNTQNGMALLDAIASAVNRLDLERVGLQGDSPQVASSMKSAFGGVVAAAIKDSKNPLHGVFSSAVKSAIIEASKDLNGELATAVKRIVAPSFEEAIRQVFVNAPDQAPAVDDDGFNFGIDDKNHVDQFAPVLPK